jgi:putative spermidine/putrescine transport system ATP-binding protein
MDMGSTLPLVAFAGVEKRYGGDRPAVVDLDLEVRRGEFFTLLGPSGSGKTTTLMMLAGFEAPTRGDILLDGASLAGRPPHRRNMGVVFQNYALFPHMTVADNLRFPLSVRGISGVTAAARVEEMLALVHLEEFAGRRPDQLSGGQRQRVALARALIFEPEIVLMDEPLGALDRQLREQLQIEIKRIQRQLGLTILYVTHDQGEALTLSDRIAVFADGEVQQVGAPETIYEHPANAFVARFVGENNAMTGFVTERKGEDCAVWIADGVIIRATAVGDFVQGDKVIATVRPENVHIGTLPEPCNRFPAAVDQYIFHGDHSRVRTLLPGGVPLTMRTNGRLALASSDAVDIAFCADQCLAFPAVGARMEESA